MRRRSIRRTRVSPMRRRRGAAARSERRTRRRAAADRRASTPQTATPPSPCVASTPGRAAGAAQRRQQAVQVGVGDELPDDRTAEARRRRRRELRVARRREGDRRCCSGRPTAGCRPTALADLRATSPAAPTGVAIVGVAVSADREAAQQADRQGRRQVPATARRRRRRRSPKWARSRCRASTCSTASGSIAWFDIEYSESTRRELQQTLAALTRRRMRPN